MVVKVVTDSTADISPQLAQELDITIVPAYTRFGDEVFRDGVDISKDKFYHRLTHDPVHPSTTQPSPQDFVDVFERLSKDADGIISIDVSAKLSGTCNSALQGKEMVQNSCPVEVVDSQFVSMALGMLVIEAATLAKAGKDLPQIVATVEKAIPKVHLLILFDTLKYLALGGRIGKAKALLGSVLSVKPILTFKDGVLVPAAQVRTHNKGKERLIDFAQKANDIQQLAIIYSTTPDEAEDLARQCGSVFPREKIILAQLGSALGVHAGPGVLGVAIREG